MPNEKQDVALTPDAIHHGAFVSEGRLVAFPTCFPGASVPIRADESHITALDLSPEGDVYGGTSGKQAHLFVGMFRGVTGAVFDMGAVSGADQCVALWCGTTHFFALVNGPTGGRVIARAFEHLPFDLIQEWGFGRRPYEVIGAVAGGERIVHAARHASRSYAVGLTEKHIFVLDGEQRNIETAGEVAGKGAIAAGPKHFFYGLDEGNSLWCFDGSSRRLDRRAIALPAGSWGGGRHAWARHAREGMLYLADDAGTLFAIGDESGSAMFAGKAPLAPVSTMTVGFDGRLYGMCGEEMAHLFVFDPGRGEMRDLGVPVSTIERRRYGYAFGAAVLGPNGEIYFGEADNLGHLWLYFPRIEP
jgi:hypothetical protein